MKKLKFPWNGPWMRAEQRKEVPPSLESHHLQKLSGRQWWWFWWWWWWLWSFLMMMVVMIMIMFDDGWWFDFDHGGDVNDGVKEIAYKHKWWLRQYHHKVLLACFHQPSSHVCLPQLWLWLHKFSILSSATFSVHCIAWQLSDSLKPTTYLYLNNTSIASMRNTLHIHIQLVRSHIY